MNERLQDSLVKAWRDLPAELRFAPATQDQLREFESIFGSIPLQFRWFLEVCGGGVVGSEWVDDVLRLAESHRKYRREFGPGGWTMVDVFIIGWDGAGNPMGINVKTGQVIVEDHNFGGIHQLASSFLDFLSDGLRMA